MEQTQIQNRHLEQFTSQFTKYEIPNFGYVRLPEIFIDPEKKALLGLARDCSNYEFLVKLVQEGYQKKKHLFKPQFDYPQQIDNELTLVKDLDFVDYFLLVWMVINKVKELGGYVDPGRGSASGSLLFWLMGITGVDPLDKGLLFSRFISKIRAKKKVENGIVYLKGDLAPDVDINLGSEIREKILLWLNQIYNGKICGVSNIVTLTGKILVKDVFKHVGLINETQARDLAGLIERHAGILEDIETVATENEDFQGWIHKYPLAYDISLKLRDIIRQKSSHASGYIISYHNLDGFLPLELNKRKELVASYDKNAASEFAIKLDLLGLTSNDIINDILQNIPESVDDIELDTNPIVYDQFQHGNLLPYGLYQIEGDFAYRVLNLVKPRNISELSDVNALARPGAAAYIDEYVNNTAELPHELFKDVLSTTRNIALYQEQMMRMAMVIGFSAEEAEVLRKIVGKKLIKEVKEWKDKIYDTAKKNGFETSVADVLWKILEDSSKYSFNKSHSVSTSYITALTVYLKYKYPLQFYLACLKAANKLAKPLDDISIIQKEMAHFDIKLLPPHILQSNMDFTIDEHNIRYGLIYIKGISTRTIEKINQFKNDYSNKFEVFQAAREAKLSIGVLSALIQAGALDGHGKSRSRMVIESQFWNLLTPKERKLMLDYGEQQQYDIFNTYKHVATLRSDSGKLLIRPSRIETLKRKLVPYQTIYRKNSANLTFANWFYEKQLLGYSYSVTLRDAFIDRVPNLSTVREVVEANHGEIVVYTGSVVQATLTYSKNKDNKKRYFKMVVEDEIGDRIASFIFEDKIGECREVNGGRLPQEGNVVMVRGKKSRDIVYAWRITIQDHEIYMKLSDCEKELLDKSANS